MFVNEEDPPVACWRLECQQREWRQEARKEAVTTVQRRDARPRAGSSSGPDKEMGLTDLKRQICPGVVTSECRVEGMGGARGTPRPLLWKKKQGEARLRDGEP